MDGRVARRHHAPHVIDVDRLGAHRELETDPDSRPWRGGGARGLAGEGLGAGDVVVDARIAGECPVAAGRIDRHVARGEGRNLETAVRHLDVGVDAVGVVAAVVDGPAATPDVVADGVRRAGKCAGRVDLVEVVVDELRESVAVATVLVEHQDADAVAHGGIAKDGAQGVAHADGLERLPALPVGGAIAVVVDDQAVGRAAGHMGADVGVDPAPLREPIVPDLVGELDVEAKVGVQRGIGRAFGGPLGVGGVGIHAIGAVLDQVGEFVVVVVVGTRREAEVEVLPHLIGQHDQAFPAGLVRGGAVAQGGAAEAVGHGGARALRPGALVGKGVAEIAVNRVVLQGSLDGGVDDRARLARRGAGSLGLRPHEADVGDSAADRRRLVALRIGEADCVGRRSGVVVGRRDQCGRQVGGRVVADPGGERGEVRGADRQRSRAAEPAQRATHVGPAGELEFVGGVGEVGVDADHRVGRGPKVCIQARQGQAGGVLVSVHGEKEVGVAVDFVAEAVLHVVGEEGVVAERQVETAHAEWVDDLEGSRGTGPFQNHLGAAGVLAVLDLDVVGTLGRQRDRRALGHEAVVGPAVDDQDAAHPDADAVVGVGSKRVVLAETRHQLAGPAHGEGRVGEGAKSGRTGAPDGQVVGPVEIQPVVLPREGGRAGEVGVGEVVAVQSTGGVAAPHPGRCRICPRAAQ